MTVNTHNDLLNSGLALVPAPLGTKGPKDKGWNLRDNVVLDESALFRLTNKNFGVAHAYCEPTPTCAIDIDDYRHAKWWLESRCVDLRALLLDRHAVVISSGRAFSLKILYRLPYNSGPLVSKVVKNKVGKVTLEFRCASQNGKTVQDILPPSLHPSGSPYKWLGRGDPLRIPQIPPHLLEIWTGLLRGDDHNLSAYKHHYATETPRQLARTRQMLSFIDANCSYFTWRNVIWSLLSTNWPSAIHLAEEWSRTAPERFEMCVFQNVIDSYKKDTKGAHSMGTVHYFAKKGGWLE